MRAIGVPLLATSTKPCLRKSNFPVVSPAAITVSPTSYVETGRIVRLFRSVAASGINDAPKSLPRFTGGLSLAAFPVLSVAFTYLGDDGFATLASTLLHSH